MPFRHFSKKCPRCVVQCVTVRRSRSRAIVLGEYRFGLLGSRLRAELEAKLGRLERLADVLCVDGETARHYSAVRRELKDAGTPIPDNDVWIAALVRQHGLPLLSNDEHFDRVRNLARIDW